MPKAPTKKVAAPTESDIAASRKRLESIKRQQDKLRDEELELREWFASNFHQEEEGSKTVKIGGEKFTIKRTLNRTIGKDEAERLSQEYPDLAVEALRWKPEVVVSTYKENKEILDDYIVTRAGPPSVEFKF
jgi:geranylgeranyl pyrophosphate synthase